MTFSNHISIFLGLSLILLASNLANATTSSWSTSVQTSSIPITSTSQAASSPTACSVTSASTFDVTISSGKTYPTAAPTNCDAQSEIREYPIVLKMSLSNHQQPVYDIGQSGCSPQGNATELQNCLSGYLVPASTKRAVKSSGMRSAWSNSRTDFM